uniref:Uncharacterized protein n=1 Tax=Noctiluca scintillans TaxID=2966 RepID=A0A7S1F8N6_NOCSC|mmetsp:Transcript_43531/g.114896  ORF Transcript_43531/g.114896 Transcript_43531/m.114896 type:complete len:772 (+) Transcript_43531:135-2450(+)
MRKSTKEENGRDGSMACEFASADEAGGARRCRTSDTPGTQAGGLVLAHEDVLQLVSLLSARNATETGLCDWLTSVCRRSGLEAEALWSEAQMRSRPVARSGTANPGRCLRPKLGTSCGVSRREESPAALSPSHTADVRWSYVAAPIGSPLRRQCSAQPSMQGAGKRVLQGGKRLSLGTRESCDEVRRAISASPLAATALCRDPAIAHQSSAKEVSLTTSTVPTVSRKFSVESLHGDVLRSHGDLSADLRRGGSQSSSDLQEAMQGSPPCFPPYLTEMQRESAIGRLSADLAESDPSPSPNVAHDDCVIVSRVVAPGCGSMCTTSASLAPGQLIPEQDNGAGVLSERSASPSSSSSSTGRNSTSPLIASPRDLMVPRLVLDSYAVPLLPPISDWLNFSPSWDSVATVVYGPDGRAPPSVRSPASSLEDVSLSVAGTCVIVMSPKSINTSRPWKMSSGRRSKRDSDEPRIVCTTAAPNEESRAMEGVCNDHGLGASTLSVVTIQPEDRVVERLDCLAASGTTHLDTVDREELSGPPTRCPPTPVSSPDKPRSRSHSPVRLSSQTAILTTLPTRVEHEPPMSSKALTLVPSTRARSRLSRGTRVHEGSASPLVGCRGSSTRRSLSPPVKARMSADAGRQSWTSPQVPRRVSVSPWPRSLVSASAGRETRNTDGRSLGPSGRHLSPFSQQRCAQSYCIGPVSFVGRSAAPPPTAGSSSLARAMLRTAPTSSHNVRSLHSKMSGKGSLQRLGTSVSAPCVSQSPLRCRSSPEDKSR